MGAFFKGLFGKIFGALFSSGGNPISTAIDAVDEIAGDVGKAEDLQQNKNERDAGAAQQREVTDAATLETINRVDAPITDAERDSVWNGHQAAGGSPKQAT